MKLTKSIAAFATGLAMAIAPAHARIEDETGDLLNLMHSSGIEVVINSERCNDGDVLGAYRNIGIRRQMVLCPGDTVDAIDHSTVRHEAVHAIQHCVNAARGTDRGTPIMDMDALVNAVNTTLTEDEVIFIKSAYPREAWAVEFEANVVEKTASAVEIMEWFRNACLA